MNTPRPGAIRTFSDEFFVSGILLFARGHIVAIIDSVNKSKYGVVLPVPTVLGVHFLEGSNIN
jgi:hypothetical protein